MKVYVYKATELMTFNNVTSLLDLNEKIKIEQDSKSTYINKDEINYIESNITFNEKRRG